MAIENPMIIRIMRPDDADAVRELDVQAFIPYMRQTGRGESHTARSRESILTCLALEPEGCFVAEDDGLIGYVFTRRWGKVGWIGTFGVDPEKQGQGIGRKLLEKAVSHLEAWDLSIIGLETMPDSPSNVGLYSRQGFRPAFMTLLMRKDIQTLAACPSYSLMSSVEPEAGIAAVSRVSHAALPGLDYAVEARNCADFGWGEVMLIGWPDPWAAAIVRTAFGPDRPLCALQALVITPQAKPRLQEAITAVESFAADRCLHQLWLGTNTADWESLQRLLSIGFRVSRAAVRMTLRGDYPCPKGVDLSRWAM